MDGRPSLKGIGWPVRPSCLAREAERDPNVLARAGWEGIY